jgi:hypothetical protein
MNGSRDLERRLTDLYADEGQTRAPDRVLEIALDTIDTTPQRRAFIGLPRRFQPMNSFAKLAIAAVAVLAIGAVGIAVISPRSPSVGPPVATPSPTTSPASPSPTPLPTPSPTPAATPLALNKSFTSPLNRISVDYPGGWLVQPATQPSTGVETNFGDPTGDFLYDPVLQDRLFIALRSSPLGGQTAAQWLAAQAVATECPAAGPVTVDGVAGTIGGPCDVVLLVRGDRGYVIRLYTGDASGVAAYDRAWFLNVLATVKLDPASAAGASASPSP